MIDSKFIEAEEHALMDFQFAILDAMKTKGISQTELAEMLGVSRARVSQLLSSEANPTIKLVGRALAALGMKANYLEVKSERAARGHNRHFDIAGAEGFAAMALQARAADRAWGVAAPHANENYAECILEAA